MGSSTSGLTDPARTCFSIGHCAATSYLHHLRRHVSPLEWMLQHCPTSTNQIEADNHITHSNAHSPPYFLLVGNNEINDKCHRNIHRIILPQIFRNPSFQFGLIKLQHNKAIKPGLGLGLGPGPGLGLVLVLFLSVRN